MLDGVVVSTSARPAAQVRHDRAPACGPAAVVHIVEGPGNEDAGLHDQGVPDPGVDHGVGVARAITTDTAGSRARAMVWIRSLTVPTG